MADVITKQELIDASEDAHTLEEVVNSDNQTEVTSRLGRVYPSIAKALYSIIQTGGFEPFATESQLLASVPTVSKKAAKALDTKKVWLWGGSSWVDTGLSELDQAKEFSKQNQNALLNAVDASTVIFGRKNALVSSSTVLSTSHVIFKKQFTKPQIITRVSAMCNLDSILYIAIAKKVGSTYVKQKELQLSVKAGLNELNVTDKLVADMGDYLVFHSSVSSIVYTLDVSDENYYVANTVTDNTLSNIIDPNPQGQLQISFTTTDFYSLSNITTEQNTLKTQSVYFEKVLSKIADYDSNRIGKSGSLSSGTALNAVPVIFAKAVEKTGVISLLEFYAISAGSLTFGSVKRKDASSFEVVQQNTVQMTVGVNRIDVTHLNIEAKAGDFLFFKSSVSSVTAVTETVEDDAAYYAANTSTETIFSNLIGPLKAARIQFGFVVESLDIKVPMLEILTQAQFDALAVKDSNTLYGVTS